jgi:hypothetical protein
MRIIDGRTWHPEGTVIAWLSAPSMTAASDAAADDPTPASFLQADHVRGVLAQRAQGAPHRAFTCSVTTLPGTPDRDRITGVVNDFVAAHEGLRSSLTVDGDVQNGTIRRRTVPFEDVSLVPVVIDGDGESDGDGTGDLIDVVASAAVFDNVPAMVVMIVAQDDGRAFELFLALDHSAGDGVSQMIGLLELKARYLGQDVPGLTDDRHPGFPGYVDGELEAATTVGDDSPGVAAWREFFAATGGVIPDFPLPTGIVDGQSQPVVSLVDEVGLADAGTLAKLSELAAEHETGLSSVIYAALGLAHKRLTGENVYATVVVSSTRGREYQFSQGWFCNFSPLSFSVEGETVGEIIETVKSAQKRMKETLREPVHASLGHLIARGEVDPTVMVSPQMVTFLDMSWFEDTQGTDIRLFTGMGRTTNASLWITRNSRGLGLASQAPDNPIAREPLATYTAAVHGVLSDSVAGSTS